MKLINFLLHLNVLRRDLQSLPQREFVDDLVIDVEKTKQMRKGEHY